MYDIEFPGWSGLVRRTAALYDLPDPLDYMNHPWVPKRWRAHVREVVTNYWNTLLKEKASSQDSLRLLDLTNLSVSKPHPIWIHAGRDALSVKKTTIVSWILLGVFQTGDRLHLMGKKDDPSCLLCTFSEDSCLHMMLSCPSLQTIREDYLCQMVSICPQIINYLEFSKTLLIAIVDPSSTKLPTEIREGWSDLSEAYRIGRNFTYAMYRKRKLLLEALAKKRAVDSNNQ